MRVLVAMSGGVDSSVAAALLVAQGHDVVGATLKLWGGPSDAGCCSVADVDDARRVAQQLGIDHHVFNLGDDFAARVVEPYVGAHAGGRTPNPCIECNRHIKFDRLLQRARRLGFDALATGHHARVDRSTATGALRLRRGADADKDQSYVLSMLGQAQLAQLVFPVGHLAKSAVRAHASRLELRTADKPDSQDVCFIHRAEGRAGFLSRRVPLHRGQVVELGTGRPVGEVEAVELVTVGQRRGMGHDTAGRRRYVVSVDADARRVVVADARRAVVGSVPLVPGSVSWVDAPLPDGAAALSQLSAHGLSVPCVFAAAGDPAGGRRGPAVRFVDVQRPVAPGQTVALYDPAAPDAVVGAGVAA